MIYAGPLETDSARTQNGMATLKHGANRLATQSADRQGKASASTVKFFSADPEMMTESP